MQVTHRGLKRLNLLQAADMVQLRHSTHVVFAQPNVKSMGRASKLTDRNC